MKKISLLLILSISLLAIAWWYFWSPCGLVRFRQGAAEIESAVSEFRTLADQTARADSAPLAELRRLAQAFQASRSPACLESARAAVLRGMSYRIDTIVLQTTDFDQNGSFSWIERNLAQNPDFFFELASTEIQRVAACAPGCR